MSDHHLDVTDALDATAAAAALVAEAEGDDAREGAVQPTGSAAATVAGAPAAPRPDLLHRLLPRISALRHELGKFGAVGIVAYAFDFTTFNVAIKVAGIDPLTATAIATAIGATISFIGNRFWTWRHRERSGLHREYALYFLVSLVGLAIGLACVAFCQNVLGAVWPVFTGLFALNVAKNVVGMGLGTLFRFWAYRTFVFRESVRPTDVM